MRSSAARLMAPQLHVIEPVTPVLTEVFIAVQPYKMQQQSDYVRPDLPLSVFIEKDQDEPCRAARPWTCPYGI